MSWVNSTGHAGTKTTSATLERARINRHRLGKLNHDGKPHNSTTHQPSTLADRRRHLIHDRETLVWRSESERVAIAHLSQLVKRDCMERNPGNRFYFSHHPHNSLSRGWYRKAYIQYTGPLAQCTAPFALLLVTKHNHPPKSQIK